jgi:hypothetical protein
MTALVYLIEQIAPGLYILIGVGLFVMWIQWSRAQRNLRGTYYELERELYRFRRANAMTFFVLFIELGLVVAGIQQVVAPALRQINPGSVGVAQALTDTVFATPTLSDVDFSSLPFDPSSVIIESDDDRPIGLPPEPTPTPPGTLIPNVADSVGCQTPNAQLQIPVNGLLVDQPLVVIGTAFTDNFAFYKFEISGPETGGQFASLTEYTQPVETNGVLGQFVPIYYQPGEYQFRLTVFDITNMLRAACLVNIVISEPILTATPPPEPPA